MNRPWLQLYTRDWLDDIALRSCSPVARSILADLMCLAHEGTPYGYLARDGQPLPEELMYGRMHVRRAMFRKSVEELEQNGRLGRSDAGVLFIPRMVKDEETRRKRAAGGSLGGNPKLTTKVNLSPNLSDGKRLSTPSRAGAQAGVPRSESDFESSPKGGGGPGEGRDPESVFDRMYSRHRKKTGMVLAQQALTARVMEQPADSEGEFLQRLESRHRNYCERMDGTEERYWKPLQEWIRDRLDLDQEPGPEPEQSNALPEWQPSYRKAASE